MISIKSLITYIKINGLLVGLSWFLHYLINLIGPIVLSNPLGFVLTYLVFVSRNYFLLSSLQFAMRGREKISTDSEPKEDYYGEFHLNVLSATFIEVITYLFARSYIITNDLDTNIAWDFIKFIPLSFLNDIIFDFFHYWTHRIAHKYKFAYRYIHKKHHKFQHPIAIVTYYQEPQDLLLTNSFPIITSLYITNMMFPYISQFMLLLMLVYKSFIEISGHLGYKTYPTSGFPQFIWVPRLLNIQLYSETHDLHHSLNNCNYSKKFSLWDKIFGTYTDPNIIINKLVF